MKLKFHLKKESVSIELHDDADVIQTVVELSDMRDLSQTLLPAVEKLLLENGIQRDALKGTEMQSDIAPVFTSYRIVEATVKSLNLQL